MKFEISNSVAASILKDISPGLALFNAQDLAMSWCNSNFKKQTWFGGAAGGKNATEVNLLDLFDVKDHKAVLELVRIAVSLGKAYDFTRNVRRGPTGSFPAELKFHSQESDESETVVCMEISDLSLNRLYEDLQVAHGSLRESMADLMAAEAELQHSVRMSTISELGADFAHQMINPLTICRDILQAQVLPKIPERELQEQIKSALKALQGIEDLAVGFRKFSNPRLSEVQICKVRRLLDDAIALNHHRFEKMGIQISSQLSASFNPSILVAPLQFLMWLNAAFSEMIAVCDPSKPNFAFSLENLGAEFSLSLECSCIAKNEKKVETGTLEKFAKRLPPQSQFESQTKSGTLVFKITVPIFVENQTAEARPRALPNAPHDPFSPLVLIVEDEPDIRRLLKRAFKNLGFETLEASDGQEAIEWFTQPEKEATATRIQVIVSDVRMPRLTGPHFLLGLRQLGINTPFIFFSSNLVDESPAQNFNDKHVHALTKESGIEELKALVSDYMGAR